MAAATLALATLMTFAVSMTLQAGRIAAQRDRANQEAAAKDIVADFLTDLFAEAERFPSRPSP
ncbi:MAG: hypothetical protein AAGA68_20345 [Pseudomonadota bacterium]